MALFKPNSNIDPGNLDSWADLARESERPLRPCMVPVERPAAGGEVPLQAPFSKPDTL